MKRSSGLGNVVSMDRVVDRLHHDMGRGRNPPRRFGHTNRRFSTKDAVDQSFQMRIVEQFAHANVSGAGQPRS
jgi:hypothetical protein